MRFKIDMDSILHYMKAVDVSQLSSDDRKQLAAAAGAFQQRLELPWDTLHRLVWIEVSIAPGPLKISIADQIIYHSPFSQRV